MRAFFVPTVFWAFTLQAFVVRSIVQKLRTGDSGLRGVSWKRGPAAAAAGLTILPSWVAVGGFATARSLTAGPAPATFALGASLETAGAALAIASQRALGRSWRIGVADREPTAFVARGPFRWVRNPFFSGMALVGAGATVAAPTWPGAIALAVLTAGIATQVRRVEEPNLREVFGDEYVAYTRRVGRFVPGTGRITE